MIINRHPIAGATALVVALLAVACSSGAATSADEEEVVIVQAPGTKSEADEQARLEARAVGHLAEARIDHAATVLSDGRVLITGGKGIVKYPRGSLTDTAEIFNPELGDWMLTTAMPLAREFHVSVTLSDGRVLVTGGRGSTSFPLSGALYDPSTEEWLAAANMAEGRGNHQATVLPDGRVLVTGGKTRAAYTNGAEIYDPASDAWTAAGLMSGRRAWHRATLLDDGRVGPVCVRQSLGAVLDAEAVRVAVLWEFTPATRNGMSVPAWVRVELGIRAQPESER